jgi:hypothetical protein
MGVFLMSEPFEYPATSHVRKHGPQGYESTESYRPWLRDEFDYRCVYCLTREAWHRSATSFHLDHFLPVSLRPDLTTDYDNLVYACSSCNSYKRNQLTPDPLRVLLRSSILCADTGELLPRTKDSARLIDQLNLNDVRSIEYRRLWIEIIRVAVIHDMALYESLMRRPNDLPRLEFLRPPKGNTRPNGIQYSASVIRERQSNANDII